ncbi:hypothetical protein WSM22_31340 [Cytophagales bacterium WSM2-2]|nr:hypothetical protein WSM22_31340 [Cytophagales bacterium WSM2-2]
MNFLKYIFGKTDTNDQHESPIPTNYNLLARKAIELIGRDSREMDEEQLRNHLLTNGVPELEARELIIFLPMAFCRQLLPELSWPSSYYDYFADETKIKRKYSDNKRYMVMKEETEKYWTGNPNNEWVLNIAGRSAEFNAINQLLNSGGRLEDVGLSESFVIRR